MKCPFNRSSLLFGKEEFMGSANLRSWFNGSMRNPVTISVLDPWTILEYRSCSTFRVLNRPEEMYFVWVWPVHLSPRYRVG